MSYAVQILARQRLTLRCAQATAPGVVAHPGRPQTRDTQDSATAIASSISGSIIDGHGAQQAPVTPVEVTKRRLGGFDGCGANDNFIWLRARRGRRRDAVATRAKIRRPAEIKPADPVYVCPLRRSTLASCARLATPTPRLCPSVSCCWVAAGRGQDGG